MSIICVIKGETKDLKVNCRKMLRFEEDFRIDFSWY